jgi:hypothetical protein
MTIQEVIALFQLYSDNSTELSESEEVVLANKKIQEIASDRPWEALKAQASGSISNSGTEYSITLPADFAFFTENNQTTDTSVGVDNNASPKVVFVGTNYAPYQIVNFSDRRQVRNMTRYAYLDLANSKIVFCGNPSADGSTYEFDYIKVPATLALADTVTFPPARFQEMIAHAMAVDEELIEKFPRVNSYAKDNEFKYDNYLTALAYWNSNFVN